MEIKQLAILGWRFIAALTIINYGLSIAILLLGSIVQSHIPGFWPIVKPIVGIAVGLVIYKKSKILGEFITADV